MKKIFNPDNQMRTEMPESDKPLHLRKITLLNQRFGICTSKNEPKTWDTIENHIKNHPVAVYNHVYKYKTFDIQKLTLCSVGIKKLHKIMEVVKPQLIAGLRKKKYTDKAKRNVSKLLRQTDPLSRVIK
jgi:hypothetical protein